jgi:hypothetical protein
VKGPSSRRSVVVGAGLLVFGVGVSAVVGLGSTGCGGCREVAVQPLAVDCGPASTFGGELHFVDAATWRSFLTDRCLTPDDATIDALVAGVDFSTQAVFVARGSRAVGGRCVAERAVDTVGACSDGLRVVFDDVESGDVPCPGDWTVAFALPRSELRAALANDDP